jgi:hypothetical protein
MRRCKHQDLLNIDIQEELSNAKDWMCVKGNFD